MVMHRHRHGIGIGIGIGTLNDIGKEGGKVNFFEGATDTGRLQRRMDPVAVDLSIYLCLPIRLSVSLYRRAVGGYQAHQGIRHRTVLLWVHQANAKSRWHSAFGIRIDNNLDKCLS